MSAERIAAIRRMVNHHRTFRNEVHGLIDLYHKNHDLSKREAISILQSIRKDLCKELEEAGMEPPKI